MHVSNVYKNFHANYDYEIKISNNSLLQTHNYVGTKALCRTQNSRLESNAKDKTPQKSKGRWRLRQLNTKFINYIKPLIQLS